MAETCEAIQSIEDSAEKISKQGFPLTYKLFFAMSWCFFVCWSISVWPRKFYIVYSATFFSIVSILVGANLRTWEQRKLDYFREFCWYANFVINAVFLYLGLQFLLNTEVPCFEQRALFTMLWAVACGPLSVMTLLNGNQLTFNHMPDFAETFIHLMPSWVMYLMRWNASESGTHSILKPECYHDITGTNIFLYFIVFYAPWWTLYFLWLVTRVVGKPGKVSSSFFYQNLDRSAWIRRCYVPVESSSEQILQAEKTITPCCTDAVLYMVIHAVFVSLLSLAAIVMFHSRYLHAVVNVLIGLRVVFLGASRYSKMLSYYLAVSQMKKTLREVQTPREAVTSEQC